MPLLDHFHPSLHPRRHWKGFYSAWAVEISRLLNTELLPERYFAEPENHLGRSVEIDVATFDDDRVPGLSRSGGGVATAVWAPSAPALSAPAEFADQDRFEVRVFKEAGGLILVAAVELVSPANKDRPASRKAFVAKCLAYLQARISVIVVDVVTERTANLHLELLKELEIAAPDPGSGALYTVAYRTLGGREAGRLEGWPEDLTVGSPLPTLPLWLDPETALPLDLERTYTAACKALRIG